jgi:4-amino-4-deoxy-L-arabinose transferase-like glycosyltransferase
MSVEHAGEALPDLREHRAGPGSKRLTAALARVLARPELLVVVAVAGLLNLWDLSINGTANTYYAAAVRSMAASWHDFLFNAMDRAGLMTVDKPPLSDWIQALSVRVFGYSSWSLLVPQALMGMAAAVLAYDLVRRRFGRAGGFVAGFALATTPTIVAVSRHNNPDELLVLLSVAAMWFALRAFETGRTRQIVLCGVMVGLGFEAKMGVALMLVPGIAVAWLWTRWVPGRGVRGNLRMVGQLLWGGLALAAVGLAWPILVTLTPAADRPWISGTADNSVWSLMFSYNGLGRIAGQTGGPASLGGGGGLGGGGTFGGSTGVFRLLDSSLGSQAGWLLGSALVAAVALVVLSRLRRGDRRTGFVLAAGITLVVTGVVFSFASGIFHPYYVSMLAPWVALLVGAGVGEMLPAPYGVARGVAKGRWAPRIVAPATIIGGAVTELVVLHTTAGAPGWATPVVIVIAVMSLLLLLAVLSPRLRLALVAVMLAGLFAAPASWAARTLGYATSSTFPTGGPESAEIGGGFGGRGGFGGTSGRRGFTGTGAAGRFGSGRSFGRGSAAAGGSATSGAATAGSASSGAATASTTGGTVSQLFGSGRSTTGARGFAPGGSTTRGGAPTLAGGGFGAGFGSGSGDLDAAAKYARAHGGGVVAVESQSTAASAILAGYQDVAGIGGFSGRESSVTAKWIAQMVQEGRLRYILADETETFGASDGRTGSATAISIAERVGRKVTFKSDGTTVTMYDLQGKAAAILAAARKTN